MLDDITPVLVYANACRAAASPLWQTQTLHGVERGVIKHGPLTRIVRRSIYAIGTSGGACAASYLFGGWDIDKTVDYICSCCRYARRHPKRLLDVLQYCDGAVERFMKMEDGKLRLYMRVADFRFM